MTSSGRDRNHTRKATTLQHARTGRKNAGGKRERMPLRCSRATRGAGCAFTRRTSLQPFSVDLTKPHFLATPPFPPTLVLFRNMTSLGVSQAVMAAALLAAAMLAAGSPPPAPAAPASSAWMTGASCNTTAGTDTVEGYYSSVTSQSTATCCTLCQADAKCIFATFVREGACGCMKQQAAC